jgi:medium-chain acyl-[acyl-carrier-protein] hydrolase
MEALAQAMLPLLDKPFAFFGHSVGALVVFELARALRKQYGREPVHLFVSGHYAPHLLDPDPPICGLPDPEFVEQISRYNGMPQQVLDSAELMQLLMPILRADLLVNETYAYTDEPPLACPIAAFAGSRDRKMSRESLEAWRAHTTSVFSPSMFEGDHFFLFSDQSLFLQRLAQELDGVLRRLPW